MMKKRNRLLLGFCAALLLPALALAEEDVAVAAGRYSVPLAQAQREVDELIATYQNTYGGTTFKAEDYAYIRDQSLTAQATYCVMDNAVEDLALNTFSDEESAALMQQAEDAYQQTLDYFTEDYASMYMNMMKEETARDMAADYLTRSGCTVESLFEKAKRYAGYDRLYAEVTDGVSLSDADVQQYYTNRYVEPDRKLFENNVEQYELYTAAYQQTAYFIPAGYREVAYIYLPTPMEGREALEPTLEKIYGRLENGDDFDLMIQVYDQSEANSTCMVHAQSTVYEPEFRDAALALENVGDVSGPVDTETGVYVIRYLSDVAGGPVTLTQESMADLAEEAVGVKKAEVFQQTIDEFAKTYPPTIYAEKIILPES